MDLTTMKSRLVMEQEIKNFNGPGFTDTKVLASLLLDIRDLLMVLVETNADTQKVDLNPASVDLGVKKNPEVKK